mmetsp:Transcript_7892/g.18604  ORF Transcript_7892/g.18604 Transcript_7892/m.18604 type:complete len:407 (-) Transcript_7892:867-2087(-)
MHRRRLLSPQLDLVDVGKRRPSFRCTAAACQRVHREAVCLKHSCWCSGQRDHCRERGPIRGRPAADSPEVLPCRSIVALYRPAPRTARQPPAAAEHFVLLQRKLQRMLDRHLCFGSECCVVGSIEVVHSIARVSDVPHTHKVCSPRQGSRRLGPEASVIPIECPQIALTVGSCGGVVVYVAHQSFVQPPTAVHSTCVRLVHLRVTFDLSSQQQPNHVVLSFVRLRCTHPRTTIQIWFPRDGIIYTVHCRKESASLDLVKHLGSAQSEPRDKVFAPRVRLCDIVCAVAVRHIVRSGVESVGVAHRVLLGREREGNVHPCPSSEGWTPHSTSRAGRAACCIPTAHHHRGLGIVVPRVEINTSCSVLELENSAFTSERSNADPVRQREAVARHRVVDPHILVRRDKLER